MMNELAEGAYFVASVLFVIGLKRLSSPKTARSGNLIAAFGMALALVGTILLPTVDNRLLILLGIAIGTVPGWISARKVKMTAMPQMVSLFNGMGGACALLISLAEFLKLPALPAGATLDPVTALIYGGPIILGIVFGAVSFTGSIVAFGKLQGVITEKPVRLPLQGLIATLIIAAMAACVVAIGMSYGEPKVFALSLAGLALVLGVLQVMPIGGADMPVVISVLNSCTGLAAAVTGFSMKNMSMIIAGTLVGAAGSLLTLLMCRAMNRSLANVLFGSFGQSVATGGATAAVGDQTMREISASETAVLLGYARKVIIIPGYGLAVAQAQHLVHELEEMLEKRGVAVKYAIHPVAGRMPGHMNVLLAEANVPYPKLIDMEEINSEFPETDAAVVIGANDVVNPAARTDRASPIFGMPILDADRAKNIIVMKRGKGVGFAGIENNLFFDPKTKMLFGDAKKTLQELVVEVKAL
jgi:NAD(P) transhydrogenase subunit beta